MHARSVWLAGITAVGVLLGGCAKEDAPATLPIVTAPPPDVHPSATETENGSAHVGSHEAELEKHLTDYIDASNRSWNSSSALDERRAYFADSCEGCLRGWTMARDAFEAGHEYDGQPIKLQSLTVDSVEGGRAVVRAHVVTPAAVLRDPKGSVLQEFRGSDYTLVYQFQRQPSGRWLIIGDEVLSG
jgi:hypothetical protein